LTASDIIRADGDGRVVEGAWNATPAIGLHVAVHHRRHNLRVVIHNHSRWGSVWSALGRIPPYDQTSGHVDEDPAFYDEYAGTVDGDDDGQRKPKIGDIGVKKQSRVQHEGDRPANPQCAE
jgi:ribulose-5-phosphate 4-epimerase/fuculose-1-phosphate aldolase